MGTSLVPFNEIDEACLSACTAERPLNIEIETQVPGRLDARQLRAAVSTAARIHPLARARLAPGAPLQLRNHWQVIERLELDPLIVVGDGRSAPKARSGVLDHPLPIENAPPFRLILTRRRRGDRLTLIMSHVASDGIGALRLLRSIARAYAGERDRAVRVGLREARALDRHFTRAGTPAWNRRMQAASRAQLDAWLAPASRVAAVAGAATGGGGVHHVRVPKRAASLLGEGPGPLTVNDRLLVALTRTIESWNASVGARSEKISLLVPLNLRPQAWSREVVANLSLATTVATSASERGDDDALARAIVAQTAAAKEDRASAGFADLYRMTALAPNLWKRAVSRFLGATTARRLMPTAVLSNLGKVEEPLSFGRAGRASDLWFSPPCPMPGCLGVGAVTYADQLFLSLRYARELLSPPAAAAFGKLLRRAITGVVVRF